MTSSKGLPQHPCPTIGHKPVEPAALVAALAEIYGQERSIRKKPGGGRDRVTHSSPSPVMRYEDGVWPSCGDGEGPENCSETKSAE
jgi:hypothetical protein